jgi:hypothetical protein
MHGGKGADIWSGPGGKFGLGRLERGSGYCVGSVVETRMGLRDDVPRKGSRDRSSTVAGNGLRDVWVIGESFWRSVGGVFDVSPVLYQVGLRLTGLVNSGRRRE